MKVTEFRPTSDPSTLSVGSASGGDLGGPYPAPDVVGIVGVPIVGTPGGEGDTISYDSGGGTWVVGPPILYWRPLMATDDGGDHWYVVVDGDGTAVMVGGV